MPSVFTMAQLAVASDSFDRSQDGKEKQGMDSVIVAAFFDELEKMKVAGQEKDANFDPVGEARGFAGLIKSVGAAKREAGAAKGAVKTLAHKPGITQPIPKLRAPMQAVANPAGNMSNTVAHGSRAAAAAKQAPTQAPGMRGGLRRSLAIGGAAGLGGVMAGNMMHHDQPQQQQRF